MAMAMAQMPLPRHPQVRFPTRPCAVEQTADHFRAEELDQVGGDAAFQVRGGSVADAAAFAGRAHVAPCQQNTDGNAVARRMGCQEFRPVEVARGFLGWVGLMALELQRRDEIMQGADVPELEGLELDLIVQRLVPRPAFYLTNRTRAGQYDRNSSCGVRCGRPWWRPGRFPRCPRSRSSGSKARRHAGGACFPD